MPVYLLHGFRWPRPLVRIHIILKNLDDAAAEWLVAPATTKALLDNFQELFPECMAHLPNLRFVEQYDPNDVSSSASSQPYAYVADICEEVRLGIDIDEFRAKGVGNEQWGSLCELRDKIAPEEKVGWYVVVCGDEDRWAPPTVGLLQSSGHNGIRSGSEEDSANSSTRQSPEQTLAMPVEEESRGFRKLFGTGRFRRKSKSAGNRNPAISSPNSQEKLPSLPISTPTSAMSNKPPQLPNPMTYTK
ncbi:hypothetical protein AC578_4487 [Pseudocercospora eumusae]|uniref:Developmental regulator protein n=1 Tax=Pseudocercospora eumusae TaxID=321146 RepID=A0A139HBZ4_9PEZI|nr:hypothetical protein AC578_4487 [Pseudocercospora eumusae]